MKKKKLTKQEIQKEKEKTKNKAVIIVFIVGFLVIVGILLLIVLPERVFAKGRIDEAISFVEDGAVEGVVISDPIKGGDAISPGSRAELDDDTAAKLVENLITVLKNAKYKETLSTETGVWKTKIVLYSADSDYHLYVDASGMYIESQGRLVKYQIGKNASAEFEYILERVRDVVG